jgi:hypothetical protein
MPKRRLLAFGEYGGVASAICNNVIAYLLFLRKCHAPAQSLLRLGPRSWVFAPACLKSKLANVVVCPVRTAFGPWSLAARHGIPGRRGYSGGEWLRPWGSFLFLFLGETKNKFGGECHNLLNIPSHTWGLFCHSNHTQEKPF